MARSEWKNHPKTDYAALNGQTLKLSVTPDEILGKDRQGNYHILLVKVTHRTQRQTPKTHTEGAHQAIQDDLTSMRSSQGPDGQ